ncbi:sugar ABC transporter permease [Clostridia bacterium]|nr:sugar ABC transporter permease [Clostridia bacterium]
MKRKIWKVNNIVFVLLFAVLLVYVLLILLPLVWGLYTSLKTREGFVRDVLWPAWPPTFNNYVSAFSNFQIKVAGLQGTKVFYIYDMFLNSLLYALGGAVCSAIVTCVTAYLVAKFPYRFSKIVYGIVIVALILPIVGALPSQLQLTRAIGVYDNMIGMWIMNASFLNIYFLIFYATFKTVAKDYAEAASIDGASNFTILTRLMIPLVKNTLFMIILLQFIGLWNDYQTPMMFLPSAPTVAYGMYQFSFSALNSFNVETIKITGGIMMLMPVLILFLVFHKKLIGNLTMGGIKG